MKTSTAKKLSFSSMILSIAFCPSMVFATIMQSAGIPVLFVLGMVIMLVSAPAAVVLAIIVKSREVPLDQKSRSHLSAGMVFGSISLWIEVFTLGFSFFFGLPGWNGARSGILSGILATAVIALCVILYHRYTIPAESRSAQGPIVSQPPQRRTPLRPAQNYNIRLVDRGPSRGLDELTTLDLVKEDGKWYFHWTVTWCGGFDHADGASGRYPLPDDIMIGATPEKLRLYAEEKNITGGNVTIPDFSDNVELKALIRSKNRLKDILCIYHEGDRMEGQSISICVNSIGDYFIRYNGWWAGGRQGGGYDTPLGRDYFRTHTMEEFIGFLSSQNHGKNFDVLRANTKLQSLFASDQTPSPSAEAQGGEVPQSDDTE